MKTYYYNVALNYDEYDLAVYSTTKSLKKGDLVIVDDYNNRLVIGEIDSEISELKAITEHTEIAEIYSIIDTKAWQDNLKKRIERVQIERIMDRKMNELKALDTLKKFADKDGEFKVLFERYQATFNENTLTDETVLEDENGE